MTPFAVERFPRDKAVMAFPAILAVHDLGHVDVVGAFLNNKDVLVAYLAFEPDPVEPVWKDDRVHTGLLHTLRLAVKDNVRVFCLACIYCYQAGKNTHTSQEEKPEARFLHRFASFIFVSRLFNCAVILVPIIALFTW